MRRVAPGLALCALFATGNAPALAQQVRLSGATAFEMLDARPFVEDSVAVGATVGAGLLRQSADGYVVRCVTGDPYCRFLRVAPADATARAVQDLDVNVWGLGQGVRLYARLRGRTVAYGEEALWPRGTDHFDLQAAFVELDRQRFRVRAGRLWNTSGIGYYDFDGAELLVRPTTAVSVRGYLGWGLMQGLHESLTGGELAALEPFAVPDARPYVLGGEATFRWRRRAALTATYHRAIRTDRATIYAERGALDGLVRVGSVSFTGNLALDLATGTVNDGRLQVWLPTFRGITSTAYAQRHRPFFEAWTIWEAFSPVGFDEAGLRAEWRSRKYAVELSGAARAYDATAAQTLFGETRTNGWRIGLTGTLQPTPAWQLRGGYTADVGFGAARSEGRIRVQRSFGNASFLALEGGGFQRLFELRAGESTVWVTSADAGLRLNPRFSLEGQFATYFHRADATAGGNWTQVRGLLGVRWVVGVEPTASPGWWR